MSSSAPGVPEQFIISKRIGVPAPANLNEVLEFIKHFEFCLLGNHDEACLKGPPKNFNAEATGAAHWTRNRFPALRRRLRKV